MIALGEETRVYLAVGATDLRKSIDALSALVVDVLHQDPCFNQVFVFMKPRAQRAQGPALAA